MMYHSQIEWCLWPHITGSVNSDWLSDNPSQGSVISLTRCSLACVRFNKGQELAVELAQSAAEADPLA